MSRRVLTADRYKEIERLLAAGRGVWEITQALKCSRRLVRQIRDGLHGSPDQPRSTADPPWMRRSADEVRIPRDREQGFHGMVNTDSTAT